MNSPRFRPSVLRDEDARSKCEKARLRFFPRCYLDLAWQHEFSFLSSPISFRFVESPREQFAPSFFDNSSPTLTLARSQLPKLVWPYAAKDRAVEPAAPIYFRLAASYGLFMPLLEFENSVET